MKATAILTSFCLSLLALACTTTETTVEGSTLEELQERLDRTTCQNRLDDLIFEIRGLLLEDDSVAISPDTLSGYLADSLFVCPIGGEPYRFDVGEEKCRIECPVGHGEDEFEIY